VPKADLRCQRLPPDLIDAMHSAAWSYEDAGVEFPYGLYFFWVEFAANSEVRFENQRGKLSPKVKEAFTELREAVASIRKAYDEGAGVAVSKVLMSHLETKDQQWLKALDLQASALNTARRKEVLGVKRGHLAYKDNWLLYWNEAWLQRRKNGKGWLISANDIIKGLPHSVPAPNESTVNRHRNRLLQSTLIKTS
jgi:hypothetical protein|tara:strand:+ start:1770 stop:2354 length:585 start_codon:yes stop_codon:yes gene_type:complete